MTSIGFFTETCAHNNTQQTNSMDFNEERGLLTFEVPLCTSTPSSSVASARVAAISNHYSRVNFQKLNISRNDVYYWC